MSVVLETAPPVTDKDDEPGEPLHLFRFIDFIMGRGVAACGAPFTGDHKDCSQKGTLWNGETVCPACGRPFCQWCLREAELSDRR